MSLPCVSLWFPFLFRKFLRRVSRKVIFNVSQFVYGVKMTGDVEISHKVPQSLINLKKGFSHSKPLTGFPLFV